MFLSKSPKSLFCCFFFLSLSTLGYASVDTVTVNTDSGPGSLRELVTNQNADTIVFANVLGQIVLTSSVDIVINRDVVIIGNDTTNTVISGNANSRIFNVRSGNTVVIDGVTLTDGAISNNGGAIRNSGNLTIRNSAILNSTARRGGGIHSNGNLIIMDSRIANNMATSLSQSVFGGGLFTGANSMTELINTEIANNSAVASGNSAANGGGVYSNGDMTITNSRILSNTAGRNGGGLFVSNGQIEVVSSIIAGNDATLDGGGVLVISRVDSTSIINTQLSGNRAGRRGGGIESRDTISVSNSTIAGNTANRGGGISNRSNSALLTINSTIVAQNTATNSPDISTTNSASYGSANHNIIGNTTGSGYTVGANDQIGVNPLFVTSVPAAPSTGGDLQLQMGSPAIDSGMSLVVTPNLDLAGNPRVRDMRVDIGAYEYQSIMAYDVSFGDPCSCTDPQNVTVGGIYYFHDVLTVNATATTVALDSTITTGFYGPGATGFYPDSTSFVETAAGSGVWNLDFWRASGTVPTVFVLINGTSTMVTDAVFRPACLLSDCPPEQTVPTLSEWGLIILILAMLSVGIVIIRQDMLLIVRQ